MCQGLVNSLFPSFRIYETIRNIVIEYTCNRMAPIIILQWSLSFKSDLDFLIKGAFYIVSHYTRVGKTNELRSAQKIAISARNASPTAVASY